MEKNLAASVTEKVKAMLAASSCSAEAKAAGEKFLAALGTPAEAEEIKNFIAELEADVNSIDSFIALCGSDLGKQIFGDQAAAMAEAGKDAKAKGVAYCLCDACTAGGAILDKKSELL